MWFMSSCGGTCNSHSSVQFREKKQQSDHFHVEPIVNRIRSVLTAILLKMYARVKFYHKQPVAVAHLVFMRHYYLLIIIIIISDAVY